MENAIASLRPMRLGEILDQAIRLYRRNFAAFIGIIALVYVPITLIQLGLSYLTTAGLNTNASSPSQIFTASYFVGILGTVIVVVVQFILVYGVATAALTHAVTNNFLGQPMGILEAYRKIGSSWARLLGTFILVGLIVLGLLIATIIPCVGWLVGPGALIFIAFAVNPLLAPIVVVEKQSISKVFRRAWDLARRRFWWLLGFMFILILFSQLVVTGPTMVVNYTLLLVFGRQNSLHTPFLYTAISTLVSLIGGLLYLPLQLTAFTLVYFDLRVRTEGFDLALLSMQTSGAQPNMQAIQELPVQPPNEKLVEWSDVGNFAILTIIGVGCYILITSLLFFAMMVIFGAMGRF